MNKKFKEAVRNLVEVIEANEAGDKTEVKHYHDDVPLVIICRTPAFQRCLDEVKTQLE